MRPYRIAGAVLVAIGALATLAHQERVRVESAVVSVAAARPAPRPAALPADIAFRAVTLQVRRGDTLSRLFKSHGLDHADLQSLLKVAEAGPRLRRLMPGDTIRVTADARGGVRALIVDLDETHTLTLERGPAGYAARVDEHPFVIRLRSVQGEIDSSLFAAAAEVGLSTQVTVALAGVFGYDIDFLQDLRVGDRFNVVHQELWRDGTKVRDGAIVVAEFVNAGRVLRAVRFEHPDGDAEYYAPDGSSMRKALMRNPIDFARISSSFSLRRHHPILNKVRAHKGVDYGAPTGTPVRATGDGKVVFRGVKGGYGNTIIVRHGATFSTLYAHLSRFAPGLSTGSRVQQEQVIGYVGRTGLATASHLHYEVLVDGVHRNPRTVKLPDAAPIPAELRDAFIRSSADALALLPAPPLRLAPVSTRT